MSALLAFPLQVSVPKLTDLGLSLLRAAQLLEATGYDSDPEWAELRDDLRLCAAALLPGVEA